MNALLQSSYPVGFATIGICVVSVMLLVIMVALNRYSPTIATPVVAISFLMTLAFLTIVIFSTLKELPESKTGELLLGALISTFTTVVVFWFGRIDGRPPDDKL